MGWSLPKQTTNRSPPKGTRLDDSGIQVSNSIFSPMMSLFSKENTNPSSMDIFDSMIFAAHNSSFSNPKGKRKRSPDKNNRASWSPSSVSPPHAKIIVNHQNIAIETHASNFNANFTVQKQGELVKVWKQVESSSIESSKSYVT